MGSCRQSNLSTSFIFLVFITATTVGAQFFFKLEHVRQKVISGELVDLLNDIKTLEDNKIQINFNADEMQLLSHKINSLSAAKSKAIEKYHKKIEALHCVNSLILATIFDNIKNNGMLDEDGLPVEEKKEEFENYKTYVARMLSVLYYGRVIAPKWIILAYSKLIVATDPGTYKKFIDKNTFFPHGVHNYRDNCEWKHMIPKRIVEPSESLNVDQVTVELYDNQKLHEVYKYAGLFTVENITMYHLIDRQNELFKEHPVVKINWEIAKSNMNEHSIAQSNLYKTGGWPFSMTDCMLYPMVFQHIVYTTVLFYSWYHVESYNYGKTHLPIFGRRHIQERLKELWPHIINPMSKAIELLDIDDNVFLPTLQKVIENSVQVHITRDVLRTLVGNMNAVLCHSLKEININSDSIFNHFVVKRSKHQRVKEMEENYQAMENYITAIKDLIKPIDNMFFIKFIWSGILKESNFAFLPYD